MAAVNVTPLEHTAIGALAGAAEVLVMMPTVAVKNALQEGRAVPRSISALYRGLGVNLLSNFPTTALQFGCNRLLCQVYERAAGQPPDTLGRVGVAMGAGAVSALVSCPSEFLVIHQQKSGQPLRVEAASILQAYGPLKLYRGLGATMARGSLYAASYLTALPALKDHLQQHTGLGGIPGAPLVAAGMAAGLLGTLVTQPADTIKTRMQAFPDGKVWPEYGSALSTARHIVHSRGAAGLFRGLLPRSFRNVGAVIVLNLCMTELVGALDDHRIHQAHLAAAAAAAGARAGGPADAVRRPAMATAATARHAASLAAAAEARPGEPVDMVRRPAAAAAAASAPGSASLAAAVAPASPKASR